MTMNNDKTFRLTLLAATIALISIDAYAGFDLSRVTRANADIEKWQCKLCPETSGVTKTVYASAGYLTENNMSELIEGNGDKQGLQANSAFSYESVEKGGEFIAKGLAGTGREDVIIAADKGGDYRVGLEHNTQKYAHNLDIDIIPANGSSPQLQPRDIGTFDERKRRAMTTLEIDKVLTPQWSGFASLIQKKNTGTGMEVDHLSGFSALGALPVDIDNTTHELKTSVRHFSEASQLQAFYKISRFDNDASLSRQVSVGQGEGLGLGDGDSRWLAVRMPEPDSTLHQMAASGNYRFGMNDIVQASVSYGLLGQDGNLVGGQVADNGQNELDGYIHTIHSRVRWLHRLNNIWRLKAQFNYDNRKNDTETLEKTSSNDQLFTTRVYTLRTQDYLAELSGRLGGARVTVGAKNKLTWRLTQNREKTDEKNAWFKGRKKLAGDLSLTGEIGYLRRFGSDLVSLDKALEYYLADLKQTKTSLGLSYNGFKQLGINTRLYRIYDDYNSMHSGLNILERNGIEVSSSYRVNDGHHIFLGFNVERNEFDQAITFSNSSNQLVDQTVDMAGVTIASEWEGLADGKFDLAIHYNWLQSIDSYKEDDANDIPDVNYRSTNIEATGHYHYSKVLSLHGLIGYQRVSERDWQLDNSLWSGNKTLNDNGGRITVGISYKFI